MRKLFGLLVILVTMVFIVVIGWCLLVSDITNRNITSLQAMVTAVDNLQYSLIDAETAQRGFIITNKPEYLEPYNNSVGVLQGQLRTIHRLLPNADASILSTLTEQKMQECGEGIRLRAEGFEPAQRYVLSQVGKQTMDNIRSRITNIKTAARLQMTSATALVNYLFQLIGYSLTVFFSCAIVLLIMIPWTKVAQDFEAVTERLP